MPTYQRSARVAAPLSAVWDFHSRISGLEALTPEWMNLRVEEVRGPGGASDPAVLEQGTTVRLSIRPFGAGPRIGWITRIVRREERDGEALFQDEMVEGPFERWRHTHRFFADGDETVVHDRVDYRLPGGGLGRLFGPPSLFGFEPMFRHRHRRTRELLEGRRR